MTQPNNPLAVNLEILGDIIRFAYDSGYHELGYDVLAEFVSQTSGPRLTSEGWYRFGPDNQWHPIIRFVLDPGENESDAVQDCFPGQVVEFRGSTEKTLIPDGGGALERIHVTMQYTRAFVADEQGGKLMCAEIRDALLKGKNIFVKLMPDT